MIEVQILIPVADNNGLTFDETHHAAFEAYAAKQFGGVTRLPATAVGVWVDSAVTYRDATRVYMVAIVSIAAGGDVVSLAKFAMTHYDQKAIYIRYLGLSEIIT